MRSIQLKIFNLAKSLSFDVRARADEEKADHRQAYMCEVDKDSCFSVLRFCFVSIIDSQALSLILVTILVYIYLV